MLGRIARRAARIIVAPEREWQSIASGAASNRVDPCIHLALLAALPPLGAMAAGYCSDVTMPAGGFAAYPADSPLASALSDFSLPFNIPISAATRGTLPAWFVFACGYGAVFAAVALGAVTLMVLAPLFGGRRNLRAAVTLTSYSATPLLISAVTLPDASLVPIIALAAMHSCYLCYLALPVLTGMPRSEAGMCTGIAIIASLIGVQVLGYFAAAVMSAAQ